MADPGIHRAVVEARSQTDAELERPALALDDAHQLALLRRSRFGVRHREAVDQPSVPAGGVERRDEHERPLQVHTRGREVGFDLGPHLAEATVLSVEHPREARARVEPGQTTPIDRALPRDERRGVTIADQGVVGDWGILGGQADESGAPGQLPGRTVTESGLAFQVADLLGLVFDPFLGSTQLFLLLAFGFFLTTLAAERFVAGDVTGGLRRAPGQLVDEAHRITSWARSCPRPRRAKRTAGGLQLESGSPSPSAWTASSSLRSAFRMMRETCIWDTPRRLPISYWLRSSSKRRRRTVRSRSVRGAPSAAIWASTRS